MPIVFFVEVGAIFVLLFGSYQGYMQLSIPGMYAKGLSLMLGCAVMAILVYLDIQLYLLSSRPLDELLASVKPDPSGNTVDENGRTPLMKAAGRRDLKKVLSLLAGGAKLETKDRFGNDALFYARKLGAYHVVKVLENAAARSH